MKRLTHWSALIERFRKNDNADIQAVIYKLAEYEDLEEQGKLLRLPVSVGETVYVVERFCELIGDCWNSPCESCPDYKTEINKKSFSLDMLDNVGESVFATREAAEAKLREMENKADE